VQCENCEEKVASVSTVKCAACGKSSLVRRR
jgi:ribosomal protein L37E